MQRILRLELSHLPQFHSVSSSISTWNSPHVSNNDGDTEAHLSAILRSKGVDDFFKRVPSNYYDWPLETRRDVLDAASIDHLCKSIVLVNTQAHSNVIDCSYRKNSKYYVVVVQVILDESFVKLTPDFFWFGGSEVDLKLGIRTSQLIRFVKPFIVSCSNNSLLLRNM